MIGKKFARLMTGITLGLTVTPLMADAPRVVTTIKPVHSIVAAVMDGVGEPMLLIDGAASPHRYSLRPSEAAAIQDADLVFWVGEDLESFLEGPLASLPGQGSVIALGELPGLNRLAFRDSGDWGDHDHDQDHGDHDHGDHGHDGHDDHGHDDHGHDDHGHDDHGHDHAHGETDMHLWLDPDNARAMADGIAAALADVDAGNAAVYARNAERFRAQVSELDEEIRTRLTPVLDAPYIVFHDAYQYFERHYGLSPVGAITVSPERLPGAARLRAIQDRLRESGAHCVFAEPQFEPNLMATVVEGSDVATGVLDPLGAELEAGPALYGHLMRGLATSLTECLAHPQ